MPTVQTAIADGLLPSAADVYRPFGSDSPAQTGLACRLVADTGGLSTLRALQWTHVLELPAGADVRDGCTRAAGANAVIYADGDEVRINGIRYVVAWAETANEDSGSERRRAYLMRHE